MMKEDLIMKVEQILAPYINSPVECDGFTYIASTLLEQNSIPHAAKVGRILIGESYWEPHFWIELSEGIIIDYRCRAFVGRTDIMEGIFVADESLAKYDGRTARVPTLTMAVINAMVMEFSFIGDNNE